MARGLAALCLICSSTTSCSISEYEERLCDPSVAVFGLEVGAGETEWAGPVTYAEGKTDDYVLRLDEAGAPLFLRPRGFEGRPTLTGAPAFGCSDPIEFPLYEGGVNGVRTESASAGQSWTNHARAVVATADYVRVEYAAGDSIQLLELRLLTSDTVDVRWFSGSVEFPENFTYLYGELKRK